MSLPGDAGIGAALAHTTASVLMFGSWFAVAGAALTLVALTSLTSGQAPFVGWLASMLLGILGLYYALRVRFDARLFAELGRRIDAGLDEASALAQLDAALIALRLRPAGNATRALSDRARGALRLLYAQALVVVAQLALSSTLWWWASR